uniref:Integrase catalytic domain-containing protein n=1 Tax=Nicotiana tabacum TaxID=4097 RepID=A0A1S4DC49_TOBAC|nr:uncharacterized protein LOC104113050 [Nicotiana tomentosiformis]XP_016510976.1 PREDICTED: uncharacterized protein LOC107828215 [Nicotiana tabacum]
MVDGKWKKERFREKYWYQWERCNAIVLSWLMNYVAQNLISEIAYTTNAQTLLKELRERFDKDEFEALVPLPDCDCSKSKDCVVFLQRLKLYQFFMGLNANYLQARSQILLMFPLPTVNQTYAMLISDEIQKAIDVNSGILGASPPNINPGRYDSTTLYSSKTGGNQKFRKNYNFYCEMSAQVTGQYMETQHAQREVSPSTISANTTGTSSVFLLSDSKSDWIIDTLATNHMVSDVNLLNKSSISELIVPRKVFLPNRYISHVAHVGTSSISDNNYLRNDLSIGKVKAIGKEYNELYLLHRHNARTNKFLVFVQTQFQKTLKVVRIDSLFRTLGIAHQRTCAYTPQQNGIAERKYKHILEVTRAIRFQAHIPIKFWGNYVFAAMYLINRMPFPVIGGVSPYERLYAKKPDLGHLRVIGCLCYAKQIHKADKLLSRVNPTVHMGYSPTQKGYILYDLTSHSFVVRRDVACREEVFLFSSSKFVPPPQFVDSHSFSHHYETPGIAHTLNDPATIEVEDEDLTHWLCQSPIVGSPISTRCVDTTTYSQRISADLLTQDINPTLRKSTRPKQTPIWMKNFISLNIYKDVPYAISNYLSYGTLSPKYHAYIAATLTIVEPSSYEAAVKDPR